MLVDPVEELVGKETHVEDVLGHLDLEIGTDITHCTLLLVNEFLNSRFPLFDRAALTPGRDSLLEVVQLYFETTFALVDYHCVKVDVVVIDLVFVEILHDCHHLGYALLDLVLVEVAVCEPLQEVTHWLSLGLFN